MFSLSSSSFHIAYHDEDEGEDCLVQTEEELTDAIWYFGSGTGDTDSLSSTTSNTFDNYAIRTTGGITLELKVVLEYDGPNLSDTSSVAESFQDRLTLNGEEYASSSAYTYSNDGEALSTQSSRLFAPSNGPAAFSLRPSLRANSSIVAEEREDDWDQRTEIFNQPPSSMPCQQGRHALDDRSMSESSEASRRYHETARPKEQASYGDYTQGHFPAPSSTSTSLEFGARWIEEQKARVAQKMGSARFHTGRSTSSSLYDDDSSHDGRSSGYDEGKGQLELVQDPQGSKLLPGQASCRCTHTLVGVFLEWLYSYSSSDMNSLFPPRVSSPSGLTVVTSRPSTSNLRHVHSSYTLQSSSPTESEATLATLTSQNPRDLADSADSVPQEVIEEPAAPPGLAPDCSACGVRLDYMRYVCTICGEGTFLLEGQGSTQGKTRESENISSNGTSSLCQDAVCKTAQGKRSLEEAVSPILAPDRPSLPMLASRHHHAPGTPTPDASNLDAQGFELCPGCIESYGIEHTRSMGELETLMNGSGHQQHQGKLRRLGVMNHTYRELIWSATGWQDISELSSLA